MNAEAIVQRAHELGIALSLAGDRIQYAPKSATPPDLVETMRQHKAEVMEYLRQRGSGAAALETCRLLAWAAEVAEQDIVLLERIIYVEAPLLRVTTRRLSWYAAHYLRTITSARIGQETGGWGMYDRHWHRKCEEDALSALAALREALAQYKSTGRALT